MSQSRMSRYMIACSNDSKKAMTLYCLNLKLSQPQFYSGGQSLLRIFPAKPTSTPTVQYNHRYVFNELERINRIRNRIAHHEPVCFSLGNPIMLRYAVLTAE